MPTEWHYQVMGQEFGPVSGSELKRLARQGEISPDTFVRKGADGDWVYADRVKGLWESTQQAASLLTSEADQQPSTQSERYNRRKQSELAKTPSTLLNADDTRHGHGAPMPQSIVFARGALYGSGLLHLIVGLLLGAGCLSAILLVGMPVDIDEVLITIELMSTYASLVGLWILCLYAYKRLDKGSTGLARRAGILALPSIFGLVIGFVLAMRRYSIEDPIILFAVYAASVSLGGSWLLCFRAAKGLENRRNADLARIAGILNAPFISGILILVAINRPKAKEWCENGD